MIKLAMMDKTELRNALLWNDAWGKRTKRLDEALARQKAITHEIKKRVIALGGSIEQPGEANEPAETALIADLIAAKVIVA